MAIHILLSDVLGKKHWTQADLIRATGIRPNTISDMYHEVSRSIKLDHLDLLCEALKCGVYDLLEREENKRPRTKYKSGQSKGNLT